MVTIKKKTSSAIRLGRIHFQILTILLISLVGSFFIFFPKKSRLVEQNDIYSSPESKDKEGCLSKVKRFLTLEEIASSLHISLCSFSNNKQSNALAPPFPLADMVMKDRSRIRTLERREYLRNLRSYRLSGLICNNHLDPSIPPVASEAAFKCLPSDYKRRACMDGRTESPGSCSKYFNDGNNYIPEVDRSNTAQTIVQLEECKASAADGISKCHEVPMGIPKEGSGIAPGQLAAGVPEAKVLTIERGSGAYIWRKEALDFHLSLIQQGKDVSPLDYPGSQKALQTAIDAVNLKDRSVAIFGSISPWVESIVHHNGAKSPTVTVDYNQPVSYDNRMKTELMSAMLESDTQFDVVISYSSIEHDGQGRYGDPLDPDGDLAAMKEVWLKVAPGGFLLVNVPIGPNDTFTWYSMRFYGPARLPILIRGWEYGGLTTSQKVYGPKDDFDLNEVNKEKSPVLILRKPKTVGVDDVLDITKFGSLACNIKKKSCGIMR